MSKVLWKGLGVLGYIVQYGCIAHCTLEFVADVVVCSGPSMEPTIHSHDIVLTEHLSVTMGKIEKGDVVIAKSMSNPRHHVCKRVTGVEGDLINSPVPPQNYRYNPKGHVYLEGDNRNNSTDSRIYGPVPYGLLRSRVIFKLWPLHEFGPMRSPNRDSRH